MQQSGHLACFVIRTLPGFEQRLDCGKGIGLAIEVAGGQCVAHLGWHRLDRDGSTRFRVHEAGDGVGKVADAHRFCQMALHAGGKTCLDVFGIGVGSECDDRKPVDRMPRSADSARRLQAVDVGHLHVHEYEVERARAGSRLDHGDRLCPVAGDLCVEPGAFRHCQNQRLVDVVIFGDQHIRPAFLPRRGNLAALGWRANGQRCGFDQRQREREGRSCALGALHRDRTTHQSCKLIADRKAETRPAIHARNGVVGLRKLLENRIDPRLADADTRICDLDRQSIVRDTRTHRDRSDRREFDRIANQIEQHLPQPQRIADQSCRHDGVDLARYLKVFGTRDGRHQVGAATDDVTQVDRLLRHRHHPRFDLGHVEDVVEQSHHRTT